jgi:hypothetical protein
VKKLACAIKLANNSNKEFLGRLISNHRGVVEKSPTLDARCSRIAPLPRYYQMSKMSRKRGYEDKQPHIPE